MSEKERAVGIAKKKEKTIALGIWGGGEGEG